MFQRFSVGYGTRKAIEMVNETEVREMLKLLGVTPSRKRRENLGYWLANAERQGYARGHDAATEEAAKKYDQQHLIREAMRVQAEVVTAVTQAGANFANLVRSFHGNL